MPFGNRTGQRGQGRGAGRGLGRGKGRGRMGGNRLGPVGNCICPSCGNVVVHEQSLPCYQINCPKCGTKMTRQ
jgi:hypothetical protein